MVWPVTVRMVENFFLKIKYEIINFRLGIFKHGIGRISDKNPTEVTPAGTFIMIFKKILF